MRAPVYHAPMLIPNPHVSFKTSNVQNPHQIVRQKTSDLHTFQNEVFDEHQ